MSLSLDREDSGSVLALGLGGWAAAVAYGATFDVFNRISPGAAGAIAVGAALAPPAALLLDASLRDYVRRAGTLSITVALMATWLAILAGVGMLVGSHGLSPEAAVTGPYALLTFFGVPVGLGLATALLQRVVRVRRSAPATSPAATPVARRASRTSARGSGAARA